MTEARLQSLEDAVKTISLPDGLEFYHAGGQHVFPKMAPGWRPHSQATLNTTNEAYVFIFRHGKERSYPRLFDGGVLELGFHALEHGWAYLGHLIPEDMTAIQLIRSIEHNIPPLVGFGHA